MNILVVEDEPEMASLLERGLREELYDVRVANDGRSALQLSESEPFDVILLDLMLPQINGIDVARRLRQRNHRTPVLMLTARDALNDVIKGLDAGADDYLTKPFSFQELLARIRALIRRSEPVQKNVIEVDDLVLDVPSYRAFRSGRELHLSQTEFRLLELLARHRARVVTRHEILESIWSNRREVEENTLDAFVRLLRKKVDNGPEPRLIQTHRGFGYSLGALH
jgi:DNA-binding response OmpR family regulator